MDERKTGPLVVVMSRRQWLFFRALRVPSVSVFEAWEAVSSTAIEHPEWDMEEQRTMREWDLEHE